MNVCVHYSKTFFSIMTQVEYSFCHTHTHLLAVSLMPYSLYFKECALFTTVVVFFFLNRIFCSPLSCILRLINWKFLALPVGKLLFSVTAICQRLKNLKMFLVFQFIEYFD